MPDAAREKPSAKRRAVRAKEIAANDKLDLRPKTGARLAHSKPGNDHTDPKVGLGTDTISDALKHAATPASLGASADMNALIRDSAVNLKAGLATRNAVSALASKSALNLKPGIATTSALNAVVSSNVASLKAGLGTTDSIKAVVSSMTHLQAGIDAQRIGALRTMGNPKVGLGTTTAMNVIASSLANLKVDIGTEAATVALRSMANLKASIDAQTTAALGTMTTIRAGLGTVQTMSAALRSASKLTNLGTTDSIKAVVSSMTHLQAGIDAQRIGALRTMGNPKVGLGTTTAMNVIASSLANLKVDIGTEAATVALRSMANLKASIDAQTTAALGTMTTIRAGLGTVETMSNLLRSMADLEVELGTIGVAERHLDERLLTAAQWRLWYWLLQVVVFLVTLQSELQIENGPASSVQTLLEMLTAAKVDSCLAPMTLAVATGKAFKMALPDPARAKRAKTSN